MAARLRTVLAPALLSSGQGHAIRGTAPPAIRPDAIEPFLDRVAMLYRASLTRRVEHGFLAYATDALGGLVTEPDAVGTEDSISWHWSEPAATVAFSFHTHPGADALCVPSGIDALGALIRGDHVVYVLTMDGRLSGWRFRKPAAHAKAVDDAVSALEEAKRFGRPFVRFLYDAFDALRPQLMEPIYAARLRLSDDDGCRLEAAKPDASFFSRVELRC